MTSADVNASAVELLPRCLVPTERPACSVELAPHDNVALVCGLYETIKDADDDSASPRTTRHGRVVLYDATPDGQLLERQRVEVPAVLDMKWERAAPHRLAIASADGRVRLLELQRGDDRASVRSRLLTFEKLNRAQLGMLETVVCAADDVLCLSLDWSNRLASGPAELVVSLSDGSCCVVGAQDAGHAVADSWRAHDFEAWTAAFDCWAPSTLLTGGDDCVLKKWDRRIGFDAPVALHRRFDGGVTTIASSHLREHVLAVGSYDARLRLFDARTLARPLCELDVGGGVWRARWHPAGPTRLLLACMHGGFKIVQCDPAYASATVDARLVGHDSLAYGADWALRRGRLEAATCSFYDRKLALWHLA